MNNVNVSKSSTINTDDIITIKEQSVSIKLEDINNYDRNFIVLYMYMLPKFPTHGIKVGMATCHPNETFWHAIKERIRVQKHELALTPEDKYIKYGLEREVIYWGVCLDAQNDNFKDYSVHNEIKSKCAGIVEKEQEWFTNVPEDDIIDAFNACKKYEVVKTIYKPRKEQQECIGSLKSYFNKYPIGHRFLLNCKMRFGKCFTTYKYCEDADIKKILILTFVPAVEDSWREDLLHINKDYDYYTDLNLKKDNFTLKDKENFVLFLSLQNYLGRDDNFQVKSKIKKLQDVDFDLCVLD